MLVSCVQGGLGGLFHQQAIRLMDSLTHRLRVVYRLPDTTGYTDFNVIPTNLCIRWNATFAEK